MSGFDATVSAPIDTSVSKTMTFYVKAYMLSQDPTAGKIIKYQYAICNGDEAITWKSSNPIYKALNVGDSSPNN
jgi:hypothetical protein